MPVTRLALTDFRSYADALIAPGTGFVVLTGENGAGKTNVLEAVSLFAPGRGLRGAALGEMARSAGGGGFSVAARLLPKPLPFNGGPVELGTGTLASAPERRLVRINGAAAAATALGEWLSILWITPAMDRLFVDPASARRRFLDRLVLAVEPGHAVHATRYDAAMRARNKLLAGDGVPDADWLTALEARMAEHGVSIADARRTTVAALSERLAQAQPGPFARAEIGLGGWESAGSEALAVELARGRARDAAAGRTLAGPHRTELVVMHLDKRQPADRCSTGEQKALLLGLVLAHADLVAERSGRYPVLLLDEVAAHLDPRRRAVLFDRLSAAGGQVWMTGTERGLFDELGSDATWLAASDGNIVTD